MRNADPLIIDLPFSLSLNNVDTLLTLNDG